MVGFGSSTSLASAYGIAVTGTITVDTLLFLVVVRSLWRKPTWLAAAGALVFGTIDLAFLGANVPKVVHGGWFPLLVGVVIFVILSTWKRGREAVTANRVAKEGPLQDFVDELHAHHPPVVRVPGTPVYLNARRETTPLALRATVRFTRALHDRVVIVSLDSTTVPHVPEGQRLVLDHLGYEDDGITHLTARLGFQDRPDIPRLLSLASAVGLETEDGAGGFGNATYFVSQARIAPTSAPSMARWRKKLFMAMWRNSVSAVDYFALPTERTVTVGSQIEL